VDEHAEPLPETRQDSARRTISDEEVTTVECPAGAAGEREALRHGSARREWFAPLDVEMVVVERGPDLTVGRYAMIAIPTKSIKPTADPNPQ